jgi:hypothetical protein
LANADELALGMHAREAEEHVDRSRERSRFGAVDERRDEPAHALTA